MRGIGYVMSYVLTISGIIYSLVSFTFTLFIIPSALAEERDVALTVTVYFIALFLVFYLPSFLLIYFGHRVRKKLHLKRGAEAMVQSNPVYVRPPVQQPIETRTVIVEAKPTPAPKKAVSVSVECKGCGARRAIVSGESSSCEYCGSPLTATLRA
ncbi:hypothetical protein [Paenibacillus paeoniae]|uniref:Zinc ribbon domain-containing protein n=1 Tax=Paenibacillus paeoniae TaxID=2292705 RepID=A0A371P6F8_9BACL|nr:hypothetical protein [Paenibacillus paeoniae]REK71537.1 hypothetical protein DX130_21290 [Paenibacillus paeoniae]